MEKLTIENERDGRSFSITDNDAFNFFINDLDKNVESWGKISRWIFHSNVDAWELTREDDRREFDQGGVSGYEIHVPNDFVSGLTDITDELSLLNEEEAEFTRRMDGQRVLSYLGVLLNREDYSDAQLAAIEGMDYVAQTKSALIDGAFDFALYFASQVVADANLTQVIIDKVLTRIGEVRERYPDIYSVSGV